MMYTVRPQKRRWPKRLVVVAVVLIIGVAGATAFVRHQYYAYLRPVSSSDQAAKLITVERGASVDQIANQLKKAGLIRSPWAFKLYVSSHDVRDALQAGTYSFDPGQSVPQIVSQLTHGKVATDLVTILPGQRLDQIRASLINYGFKASDVDAALNPAAHLGNPALVDKPEKASLEGYLYPDSFQKTSTTQPREIIQESLAEMDKQLTPELREAFAEQGLSTYEGIILASIVEQEVSNQNDRTQVAQVFLLRLRQGMPLGSDATKHYFDSYQNKGLPPTPINNVTASSLQAVAHPAGTDWLYFVSGDDGVTHFSHTLEEQEAAIRQYCHKLCSVPN